MHLLASMKKDEGGNCFSLLYKLQKDYKVMHGLKTQDLIYKRWTSTKM